VGVLALNLPEKDGKKRAFGPLWLWRLTSNGLFAILFGQAFSKAFYFILI
jgi:hypothetical protein